MEWDFTFLMSCVLMFFQQPIMTDTLSDFVGHLDGDNDMHSPLDGVFNDELDDEELAAAALCQECGRGTGFGCKCVQAPAIEYNPNIRLDRVNGGKNAQGGPMIPPRPPPIDLPNQVPPTQAQPTPPEVPGGNASQDGGSALPSPFENINPSEIGMVLVLSEYLVTKANGDDVLFGIFAQIGTAFAKGNKKYMRGQALQKKIEAEIKRVTSAVFLGKEDVVSPNLFVGDYFDWTVNTQEMHMSNGVRLPHSSSDGFEDAATKINELQVTWKSGFGPGFAMARVSARKMFLTETPERHQKQHKLFINFPMYERANLKEGGVTLDLRGGVGIEGANVIAAVVAPAEAALNDEATKAAIGAPDGAFLFKKIGEVHAAHTPVIATDVASAAKAAVAALGIALAALQCAKKAAALSPWVAIPELEKKRLLDFQFEPNDNTDEKASKLFKATLGDIGSIMYVFMQKDKAGASALE